MYKRQEQAQTVPRDTFSIYQLKSGNETLDYRFEPLDAIRNNGLSVKPENYELVYTAPLTEQDSLESIYTRFNINHPADFKGHSLSVSDIVVLHQDGENTAHYLSLLHIFITEAEKYLGYPYVWGGSSPSTSFDCSGFVSYVLTNSGLCNTGRLGAQGLYNISTRVSDPQPGDLVFFVGTYDTAGISHVGFYVGLDEAGNPMFLHCGDPIQYARLNTSYWQQHFYAYGRPPYD